jgi:16S rRNA (adenine1518-N6/adenine1519-N6)-dimethyltransferase
MKKGDLRALLEIHGLRPNARFGQNFLVDPALLRRIPEDAGVEAGDQVLEVGPGAGALTFELLAKGAQVCAVELDRGLAALLRERFAAEISAGQMRLIEGDALDKNERLHSEVEAWWRSLATAPRLVANLPYSISGPFLARLPGRALQGATLLLQREVAEKAAGPTPGGEWSPLSIRLSLAFTAKVGRRLPPEVFWPRPTIESAFLHLNQRADALPGAQDLALREVLREAFGQRRKRLLGRLRKKMPNWADALEQCGVCAEVRPGEVGPEIWRAAVLRLS